MRALQVGHLQRCLISLSVLLQTCRPTFNPAGAAPIALPRTSFIVVETAYRTKTALRRIPERLSEMNAGRRVRFAVQIRSTVLGKCYSLESNYVALRVVLVEVI